MLFTLFLFAKVTIAVSISPIKGIVEEIGGKQFRYEVVYPEGANPHLYEPKPSDVLKVKKSDVFIFAGRAEPGAKKLCRLAKRCISLERLLHTTRRTNPHIWLNPLAVHALADTLATLLSYYNPEYKDTFLKRAEKMKKIIDSLLKLNKKEKGTVLLMHGAFVPLFTQLGYKVEVIAREPGVEPGATIFKTLKEKASREEFILGVCEEGRPCKILKIVAEEAHFPVIFLNPLYNTSFTRFLENAVMKINNAAHSSK